MPPTEVNAQQVADARVQLATLEVPEGWDTADFGQLRRALDAVLEARAQGKLVSELPSTQGYTGLAITSGDGTFHLTWTYQNTGDYNSDGEVNISDLTPIGIHLRKTSASPDWNVAQAADGDGNGEVTIGDLTPIGQNLFVQVNGYNIYGGDNPTGPWTLVDSVPTSEGTAGFPKQFDHDLTASPTYTWYVLAPYDGAGADAVGRQTASPGALVQLGQSTTVVPDTAIDSTGGTVTAPVGSPIEGTSIVIPAGAFEVPTQVSLGFNDGTVTFANGSQLGQIIEFHTDYGQAFVMPITLTVPVSTDPSTVPIPHYINPSGRLELCEVTGLDQAAGTMTFEMWHASSVVVQEARADNPFREDYDTGFDPAEDGFQVDMMQLQDNAALGGLAMICFAEWYRRSAVGQSGRLYRSFMQDVEGKTGQYLIARRAQNSLLAAYAGAGRLSISANAVLTPEQRWIQLRSALRHGPQVVVREKGTGFADYSYVLVFAYVGNDVFFWDPLFPGETRTGKHDTTSHEVTLDTGFLMRNFFGTGSLPFSEPFSNIYADALRQFDHTADAEVTIESHQHKQVVNEGKPNITGKVESGEYLVDELWFINRTNSLKAPAIAQVGLDGKFQVKLPLQMGENWFEVVARAKAIGDKHKTVMSNFAHSEGFMLQSTVEGGGPSPWPIVAVIQQTSHVADPGVITHLYAYDPDGSGYEYSETGSTTKRGTLMPSDFQFNGSIAYGVEHLLRANRNGGAAGDPVSFEIKVYLNFIGETDPGFVEIRDRPENYEWEGIETFSGSIDDPDGPPWDTDGTGPGWSEDFNFTPMEPIQ